MQVLLGQFFLKSTQVQIQVLLPRKLGSEYLDLDLSGLETESAKSSSLLSRTQYKISLLNTGGDRKDLSIYKVVNLPQLNYKNI